MTIPSAIKYNPDVIYRTGCEYEPTHQFSFVNQIITINSESSFNARFLNIWENYKLRLTKDKEIYDNWITNQMQFWQNQLNFAVWSATSGCGVSKYDHLQHKNPMIITAFRFHVYYQIRRTYSKRNAMFTSTRRIIQYIRQQNR